MTHDSLCPIGGGPISVGDCFWCEYAARVRADEAKKWVRQVAEASQRVLDQRSDQEARVMILRGRHRKALTDIEAEIVALKRQLLIPDRHGGTLLAATCCTDQLDRVLGIIRSPR